MRFEGAVQTVFLDCQRVPGTGFVLGAENVDDFRLCLAGLPGMARDTRFDPLTALGVCGFPGRYEQPFVVPGCVRLDALGFAPFHIPTDKGVERALDQTLQSGPDFAVRLLFDGERHPVPGENAAHVFRRQEVLQLIVADDEPEASTRALDGAGENRLAGFNVGFERLQLGQGVGIEHNDV